MRAILQHATTFLPEGGLVLRGPILWRCPTSLGLCKSHRGCRPRTARRAVLHAITALLPHAQAGRAVGAVAAGQLWDQAVACEAPKDPVAVGVLPVVGKGLAWA